MIKNNLIYTKKKFILINKKTNFFLISIYFLKIIDIYYKNYLEN